ncbi:hypothetical protein AAG906_021403 [Vitis piasezkii]
MALILVMIVMSDIDVFNIGHAEHNDHHSYDHTHDPGVSSVSIVCEGSLDLEKANIWLGTLLLERSEDIYWMKGLLSVQGMDERFVFQVGLMPYILDLLVSEIIGSGWFKMIFYLSYG